MNTWLFMASVAIAIIGPILAISYLRPILTKVLVTLCDAEAGTEFWIRCAHLLASISHNVWAQVRMWLVRQDMASCPVPPAQAKR